MFLQNVKEGYFADPIYGGNRDMAAWKMIGFPGAHYNYKEWVARHGEPVPYRAGRSQGPAGLAGGLSVATMLPAVDAVLVGFGWTGAIMGQQLCDAGLSVVALERGPWRDTSTDFAPSFAQDELRYMYRHHLFQNVAYDTLTVRNNAGQDALPMRHLGSFLPGTGVGSGGVHWNGQIWRFLPTRFPHPKPQRAALRQAGRHRPRAHGAGLGRHLRRARAVVTTRSTSSAARAARPAT